MCMVTLIDGTVTEAVELSDNSPLTNKIRIDKSGALTIEYIDESTRDQNHFPRAKTVTYAPQAWRSVEIDRPDLGE